MVREEIEEERSWELESVSRVGLRVVIEVIMAVECKQTMERKEKKRKKQKRRGRRRES